MVSDCTHMWMLIWCIHHNNYHALQYVLGILKSWTGLCKIQQLYFGGKTPFEAKLSPWQNIMTEKPFIHDLCSKTKDLRSPVPSPIQSPVQRLIFFCVIGQEMHTLFLGNVTSHNLHAGMFFFYIRTTTASYWCSTPFLLPPVSRIPDCKLVPKFLSWGSAHSSWQSWRWSTHWKPHWSHGRKQHVLYVPSMIFEFLVTWSILSHRHIKYRQCFPMSHSTLSWMTCAKPTQWKSPRTTSWRAM